MTDRGRHRHHPTAPPPGAGGTTDATAGLCRALTPAEFARRYRIGRARVRRMIEDGTLGALDVSPRIVRRRLIITPEAVRAWEAARRAGPEPRAPRRRRRPPTLVDFFPGD